MYYKKKKYICIFYQIIVDMDNYQPLTLLETEIEFIFYFIWGNCIMVLIIWPKEWILVTKQLYYRKFMTVV